MSTLKNETDLPREIVVGNNLNRFQPEVQGLRAIAVLLVVIYHLWPERLTGGYIGVDIFFVISGYLITAHIYREILKTGSLSLTKFWARRIRRLLPLSFVVLAVSFLLTLAVLPATVWDTTFRQLTGSALYVQNWVLAGDAVEYSAQDEDASIAQHFWSLSVEEQFYVAWPLLLVGLLFVSRKLQRTPRRRAAPASAGDPRQVIIGGLTAVGLASLIWSVVGTAYNPATAYFITPTRVWEFVVGALAGMVFLGRQFRGPAANALGWAGLLMIVIPALVFTAQTPFPGWVALIPVLGAGILIVCGSPTGTFGVHRLLSTRPAIFLGDISYGVYLWHWPLIIAAPFILGDSVLWYHKLMLLGLTVVLAWASKVWVEDPFRRSSLIKAPVRSYTFAFSGMAVIVAAVLLVPGWYSPARTAPAVAESDACYGPGALDPANGCAPMGDEAPFPAPADAARQVKEPTYPNCQALLDGDILTCSLGAAKADARTTVAVVGDSYATRWLPPIDEIGRKNGWEVKTFTRSACTPTLATRTNPESEEGRRFDEICAQSVAEVRDRIAADESISIVFMAASQTSKTYEAPPGTRMDNPAVDGITSVWQTWLDAGKKVVAIDETPRLGFNVATCLAENPDDPMQCASKRSESWDPETSFIRDAAATMEHRNFFRMNFDDQFCDNGYCYPVIGSLTVYIDTGHLSEEYARALEPVMADKLTRLGLL